MVSSVTRNARAISAVSRPPRARSVSATCPSSGSAGWQQVKISSSRSSLITVSSNSSIMASGTGSRWIFSARVLSDGVTLLAFLELEPGQEHPLRTFPAYAELLEGLKQWYAEPPTVEHMTVIGSYRLF